MAINKIAAPLSTSPSVFAAPVVNQLLALSIDCNHGSRISGGYVKKGSMFNISGAMFYADSDTAITGTRSSGTVAIKFSVSGNKAIVSYTNTLNSATWNGAYQGYYDSEGNMYYFECQAGLFTQEEIRTVTPVYGSGFNIVQYKVEKTGIYSISVKQDGGVGNGKISLYVGSAGILIDSTIGNNTWSKFDVFFESGDIILLHLDTVYIAATYNWIVTNSEGGRVVY